MNNNTSTKEEINANHLKMMRLLFLCLLLLPAATAVSEEIDGSGDDDVSDDEDLVVKRIVIPEVNTAGSAGKLPGDKEAVSDNLTMIVIIAGVAVLTLSVIAIVAVMLVRRRMHYRQQGIYSVPAEQDQKVAVPFLVE